MFFTNDLLVQRSPGMAVIWLAATLGTRGSYKKLSKKEVIAVNVVKAWYAPLYRPTIPKVTEYSPTSDYLAAPPEPLALRVTSNLLLGVTRVFSQQYTFFLAEVNNVLLHLKRSFATQAGTELNMAVTEARREHITFGPEDEIDPEALLMPNLGFFAFDDLKDRALGWTGSQTGGADISQLSLLGDSNSQIATEFDYESGMSLGFSNGDSGGGSIAQSFVVNGVGGSLGSSERSKGAGASGCGEKRKKGEASTKTANKADITLKEVERYAYDANPADDFLSFGNEMDLQNDIGEFQLNLDFPDNFDLFDEAVKQDHTDGKMRKRRFEIGIDDSQSQASAEAQMMDAENGVVEMNDFDQMYDLELPGEEIANSVPAEAVDEKNLAKRRKRTTKKAVYDEEIELPNSEVANMERAKQDLFEAKRQYDRKVREQEEISLYRKVRNEPALSLSIQPESPLWKKVLELEKSLDQQEEETKKNPKMARTSSDQYVPNGSSPRLQDLENLESYFDNDFGQQGAMSSSGGSLGAGTLNGIPASATRNNSPDFEILRHDDDDFMRDGASIEEAPVLPWHMDEFERKGSETSGSTRDNFTGIGSDDGSVREGSRRTSSRRSDISPIRGDLNENSILFSDVGFENEDVTESQVELATFKKETNAFLKYVREIMHRADANCVYFEDLVPKHSSRAAAARGFFNILVLSTQNVLKVEQEESYGEIKIELA